MSITKTKKIVRRILIGIGCIVLATPIIYALFWGIITIHPDLATYGKVTITGEKYVKLGDEITDIYVTQYSVDQDNFYVKNYDKPRYIVIDCQDGKIIEQKNTFEELSPTYKEYFARRYKFVYNTYYCWYVEAASEEEEK